MGLDYESEIDKIINSWSGQYLSRSRQKRALFRRKHHYFSYLKYWSEYQQKFAYLDAKSQGLLAISAILTAVYLVLIGGPELKDYFARSSAALASLLGILLLIAAQILLLRCFSTTAGGSFRKYDGEAIKLEERVSSGGGKKFFGRTRTLESNIDSFLRLHLRMIQATGNKKEKLNRRLLQRWTEIRSNNSDTFESFEKDISEFLGLLRDEVEDELSVRHDRYHLARRFVLVSLFLLLPCVLAYSFDNLIPDQ